MYFPNIYSSLCLLSHFSMLAEQHRCVRACVLSSFSCVWLFVTSWTVALQAPLSMGILQVRILKWVTMPSSRGSSWPRDQTCVSASVGRLFTTEPTGKPILTSASNNFKFWSPLYLEGRERPGIHPDQPGEKYSVCTQMSCILGLDYAEQGARGSAEGQSWPSEHS